MESESTLDRSSPERIRKVLLHHSNPSWPYPTKEDALELVALLAHLNALRRLGTTVGETIRVLQVHTGSKWFMVAPRQWEHFRSVCQDALLQFSEARMGTRLTPICQPLALLPVFGLAGYTSTTSFRTNTPFQSDIESENSFDELKKEARNLQRRYEEAGHDEAAGENFWFIRGHLAEGVLSHGHLRLLSGDARNALLEHVRYIASLEHLPKLDQLPTLTQLLVNSELGARYLEVERVISHSHLSTSDKDQYHKRFTFTYITTLPLEPISKVPVSIMAIPEGQRAPNVGHLLGTAAVEIYTRRVEAVVHRLNKRPILPAHIKEWKAEYLAPLKDWKGEGWSPSDIAAEWAELQTAENRLLAGYDLVIPNLPKRALAYRSPQASHSLSHSYARISHRMARRIGTTKEAWEAERAPRF